MSEELEHVESADPMSEERLSLRTTVAPRAPDICSVCERNDVEIYLGPSPDGGGDGRMCCGNEDCIREFTFHY